jgi:ribosome-binding factor A
MGDLLRAELSQIILRRVRDPRVRMTTVTAVDLSPDLRYAVVRVSVVGDESDRAASIEALRHAAGFVRRELASGLSRMKTTPELRFELDRGAEYSQRISDLLEGADEHDQGT